MKTILLFFIALFTVTVSFAQEVVLDPSFGAIKSFFLPAITGGLLALFHDARKHMFKSDWDWMLFLKTNVFPFVVTALLAAGIYLLIAYVPFLLPVLEIFTESDLSEFTTVTVFAAATKLVKLVFKTFLKLDAVIPVEDEAVIN